MLKCLKGWNQTSNYCSGHPKVVTIQEFKKRVRYHRYMMKKLISGGLVHEVPSDLEKALTANTKALEAWESISVKARNEWICWTVTVKQEKTRIEHIKRTCTELTEGIRRPCCWVGCIHRTDKPASSWAQKVLIDKQPRTK